jgi:WD40 repeat protein
MAVAVTPDGKRAISGSDDNTLKVWDLQSGRIMVEFASDGAFYQPPYRPMIEQL